jgi:hypothetical protein
MFKFLPNYLIVDILSETNNLSFFDKISRFRYSNIHLGSSELGCLRQAQATVVRARLVSGW